MGVSEALYIPAGLSLIADFHTSKTRSLAIGIHMTGLYMGQALGGFGATIADKFSWNTAFQSFGIIGIIYSVVLIIFLKEKKVEAVKMAVANTIKLLKDHPCLKDWDYCLPIFLFGSYYFISPYPVCQDGELKIGYLHFLLITWI